MRRFTKSVLTLLCLMVGSVNAFADEEIALTQAMFQTWNGYDADAVATGAATVDFNIGNDAEIAAGGMVCGTSTVDYLTYADITGSSKLVIEGTAGLPLRVLMNRQTSNTGPLVEKNPTIGENGKVELDLTDLTYVHINAIKVGWGSSAGKVNSIKFVKPSDPLAVPKEALKKAIGLAKLQSPIAKTAASFENLTKAIADAEAALAAADATATSLEAAATALKTAIEGLVLADGYSELTKNMFFTYAAQGDAEGTLENGCAYVTFEGSGLPYGLSTVAWVSYANLSSYDQLVVTVADGTPRFCFNRLSADGQDNDDETLSKMIDIPGNARSTAAYQTIDETNKAYTIDLKKMVENKGFAYLHCIKGANYQNVTVSGMYLYKAPAAPAFEPAYGTIWENGETTADGDYSLISLNKAYFNDFAKVADTLKIDFNVVSASRAAAPARNIKKGEISLWAGTDEVFTLSNIMADVDNINIAFTEDMIAKLAAADAVTLKFKNMTVSKVVLAEKIVPPFQPTDVTEKVNKDGWQSAVGSVGSYTKDVAQKEQYLKNTTTNGEILYQTVEGLENGTYTVELYANASYTTGRGFASAALNGDLGRVIVYAGDVEKTIPVIYQTDIAENNIVKLENVVVSDGTLKMGMRKDLDGSNWHTIQIKSLVHESLEANADEAAQNEYWKGIATTILGTEAYANIAGSEKAAMVAAETKAAVKAAIAPFYAAKEAYDALVDIINKGKSVDIDMTEAETLLNSATTTADQAAAKAAELKHTVNLAVNTKAVEGTTAENPVVTNFVINGTFDQNGVVAPWKTTTNAQNQTTATNQQGAFTGNFFENWNPSAFTGKIYQEIEDIPNGNYTLKIAAFVNNFDATAQFVYANGDQVALTAGEPTAYEVKTVVVDNKIEIGLNQIAAVANWMGIDNVSLVYYGETNIAELVDAYNNALLAAQAVDGKMHKDVKAALLAAINAQVDKTNADQLSAATAALVAATKDAKASVNAYIKAAGALNSMKTFTENTNFYTAEALENYYTKWAVAYEADTLKTDEANALQDPNIVAGHHSANTVDDLLMSVWDENPENWNSYHVNNWSIEGNNDGTGFVVPFIEYWTGDDRSLAAKTLTATVNVEKDGIYDVQAWVRVRVKDGGSSVADGITMTVNDGDAVDVCAGIPVDNSKFFINNFTARGIVENNTLTLKFIVADANNISWLAFRDVKYTFNEEATTGISSVETVKTLNGNIYNLNGQKVEKAQKGLYIMNGKKVYVK